MIWINLDFLENEDQLILKKELTKWFKKYKIDKRSLGSIEISKRLRSNDGVYTIHYDLDFNEIIYKEIKLAYKHYIKFGIKSFVRVFRHELAHHICNMIGEDPLKHNFPFKLICLDMNACIADRYAVGKFESLKYDSDGLETPYLWKYKCPSCGKMYETKRRLSYRDKGCLYCDCKVNELIEKKKRRWYAKI